MHARVTTAQGRPGETEQVLRLWQEQILPAARQQAGFKGVLVLADPGTGKRYSVSLWDSQADAERTLSSDYMRQVLDQGAPLLTAQPTQEHMEVLLDERA